MASALDTTITSRRSILKASIALAAALFVAAPVEAAAGTRAGLLVSSEWDATFTAWQRADTIYSSTSAASKEWDDLGDEEQRLWRALMTMPSPTASALLWKLDYLWGDDRGNDEYADSWSNDIVQAVMKDARRMLGGAA